MAEIRAVAEQSGRALPADFDVAPQLAVALGRTREEALKTFEESQIFTHMRSLSESTLKGRQADLTERNLIGSPDDVLEQVQRYADAGATTLSALLFAANDVPRTLEQMQEFSESIIAVVNKTASTEEEQRAQDDGTGDDNVRRCQAGTQVANDRPRGQDRQPTCARACLRSTPWPPGISCCTSGDEASCGLNQTRSRASCRGRQSPATGTM